MEQHPPHRTAAGGSGTRSPGGAWCHTGSPARHGRQGQVPGLPPPPPLLLCKLFAKAFISAAKPPCARVIVATPSHRTGPSVASRHAARFLRRPLRKAPLYPRFGGFLFFFPAVPGRPVPGRYTFTKALSCARSLPLPPGPCADAPWDGLRGWHGVHYPKLPTPARGFGSAGGQRSGSCPQSLPRSGSEPCVRGWQGSSPPCTVLLSPGHLEG